MEQQQIKYGIWYSSKVDETIHIFPSTVISNYHEPVNVTTTENSKDYPFPHYETTFKLMMFLIKEGFTWICYFDDELQDPDYKHEPEVEDEK